MALVAGGPHPREAERQLGFLMTTERENVLAAGPAQSVGKLPQSVAADVRPARISRNPDKINIDWDKAVTAYASIVVYPR